MSPMTPPEISTRALLTRQQRNMALAGPIARLSAERRRVIFKDDPALVERVDLQYLCLSAIDFVMERTAISPGAEPEEIVLHVAGEAARMKPELTTSQQRRIGQVVLDYLSNAREGHKAFREEYYDAERDSHAFHDFRLLALSLSDDDVPRFKLALGAQTLTLAMLDISPAFAQEAEAMMIRRAVERGHFDDAHTLARRARMRSIHYSQFIDDRLFEARRSAGRVNWTADVVPELDRARDHLKERRDHESAIIDSVRGHIAHATGEARDRLIDLMTTMADCHQRHAALLQRVGSASDEFRELQVSAFRTHRTRGVPDLEDRILIPLLAAPMSITIDMSNAINLAFSAPSPPWLFNLALIFATATLPRSQDDPVATTDDHDIEEIRPVLPEFADEDLQDAEEWLIKAIETRARLDIATAITMARDQGMADSMLRCVLFLMLRSWCPEDDPLGVLASIDGAIAEERVAGDNLLLVKDEARWSNSRT